MGHTDVVPVHAAGWREDPFGGELITDADGVDEVWGRGAVDMLNLTASMAVAFRDLADRGVRPAGRPRCTSPSPTRRRAAPTAPAGSPTTTPTPSAATTCSPRAAASTTARPRRPSIGVTVAEKGVAWRRLRVRGTPGHGSMPFRIDNALVKAAAVVQRLAEYRPAPRFHELWPARVEALDVDPTSCKAALLDPARIDDVARRAARTPPPPPTSTPAPTRRSRPTWSTAA